MEFLAKKTVFLGGVKLTKTVDSIVVIEIVKLDFPENEKIWNKSSKWRNMAQSWISIEIRQQIS